MSKYANLEEICFTLSVFLNELKKQAAALRICENMLKDENGNMFLETTHDALWREMLTEISKNFDPSSNKEDENCSFLRLREECLSSNLFPGGEKNELIKSIDLLIKRYELLPIKKSRNKQLSHHDMKQIFKNRPIEISMDDVESLIVEISNTLESVYDFICFAEIKLPKYELIKLKVEEDFRHLLQIN